MLGARERETHTVPRAMLESSCTPVCAEQPEGSRGEGKCALSPGATVCEDGAPRAVALNREERRPTALAGKLVSPVLVLSCHV